MMKYKIKKLIEKTVFAIFLMLFMINYSLAQKDGDPVSIGIYRTQHSQILNEDRTILVNLPKGYDESAMHYPVLFVLYGGQVQGYFAESVHIVDRLQEASLIPQLIIVGVQNVDRYRDNLAVDRNGEKRRCRTFLKIFYR